MLRSSLFLLTLAAIAAQVGAGGIDIAEEVRRSFGPGIVYPRQASSTNLQAFTGALGGVKASAITDSGDTQRPFEVDGDTFTDFQSAANRACDNQHNSCAELANNGTGTFTVGECDTQNTDCKSAATSSTTTAFTSLVSSNAEFDFFCEN